MKRINIRGIIGNLLLITTIILLISGIALFISPSGRIARDTNWRFIFLSKFEWEDIHTYFGFFFIVVVGVHLYFNRRPLFNYIKKKTRVFFSLKREFVIAVVLSILMFWVFYKGLFPLPQIKTLQEYAKYGSVTTQTYNEHRGGNGKSH